MCWYYSNDTTYKREGMRWRQPMVLIQPHTKRLMNITRAIRPGHIMSRREKRRPGVTRGCRTFLFADPIANRLALTVEVGQNGQKPVFCANFLPDGTNGRIHGESRQVTYLASRAIPFNHDIIDMFILFIPGAIEIIKPFGSWIQSGVYLYSQRCYTNDS